MHGQMIGGEASQRPTLLYKTIETVVTENEMVEHSDAQYLSNFTQTVMSVRSSVGIKGVGVFV